MTKIILQGMIALILFQGCVKVQDTDDDIEKEKDGKTQGVVFSKAKVVFGATTSGIKEDVNGRQSLYTNKLVGSIDTDGIVYKVDGTLVGICIARTDTTFDDKGYLIGECDLYNEHQEEHPNVECGDSSCSNNDECSNNNECPLKTDK